MNAERKLKFIAKYFLLIVIFLFMLGPVFWMLSNSLKTQEEIYRFPPTFFPQKVMLSNYLEAWKGGMFSRYFLNSLIVSVCCVITNVFFGSLSGFAFARLNFPGRDFLFVVVLATMMVPGAVLIVPLLAIMKNIPFSGPSGWLNTYQGLIMPGAVTGFSIFLFRQYFLSIPRELDEQAYIDGCSKFQVYHRIILPLSLPAITLVSIFTFLQNWNDYLWPLVIAKEPSMFTIQIGLKFFQTQYNISWQLLMAGSVIATIPILIIFLTLQSYFQKGLGEVGMGVKG